MSDRGPVLSVLIADDHALYRAGLRALIAAAPDLEPAGEAGSVREAVALAVEQRPDMLVTALHLPDGTGVDVTQAIRAELPAIGVLVLAAVEDEPSLLAAIRAGARGYGLKGAGEDDILRAMRCVGRGETILGATSARRLAAYLSEVPDRPACAFPDLTEREREVLELLAAGRPNGEIALTLHVSPKTVRNHVSAVLNKLAVSDRAQAAIKARDAGLGRGEPGYGIAA